MIKRFKIWDKEYEIDLRLPTVDLIELRSLLVEARAVLRVAEGRARLEKAKALSELLKSKDLPEWKLKLKFEVSKESVESQNNINAAQYAVDVLETAILSGSK